MSDAVDELIRDIVAKHGIAVGRDDPIMILQTINQRLLIDGAKAQEELLGRFKEELEGIAQRSGAEAKEKAERLLNAGVTAAREMMQTGVKNCTEELTAAVRQEMEAAIRSVDSKAQEANNLSKINLIASGLVVLAAAIALLANLFAR